MDSLIEIQRHYHEERERILDALTKEVLLQKHSQKQEINSGHRIKQLMQRHKTISEKLLELYADKDGLVSAEIEQLSSQNEFAEFYTRIRDIQDFYRKNSFIQQENNLEVEFTEMALEREKKDLPDSSLLTFFTDEENYGKFMDMHENYNNFINVVHSMIIKSDDVQITYIDYLRSFESFELVPAYFHIRSSFEYLNGYLLPLRNYIVSFIDRAFCNIDHEACIRAIEAQILSYMKNNLLKNLGYDFESYVIEGELDDGSHFSVKINLSNYFLIKQVNSQVDFVVTLNESVLEKCDNEKVLVSIFSSKLHCDKEHPLNTLFEEFFEKLLTRIILNELIVGYFADIYDGCRNATINNIERKQARTAEEIISELNKADEFNEDNPKNNTSKEQYRQQNIESNLNAPIYNPKNLPLDVDGKPIPYWLFKLHGLNFYFDCEICGNERYRGPRAFQQHFFELKHAHGMKCLGIPNSPHFAGITKISEALNLWNTMKSRKRVERWDPNTEEEFEDSQGNVISKKVYDDLRRQGLL